VTWSGTNANRPAFRIVASGLWVVERPLRILLALGYLPCRMTVIRLADGGLFLHSPVRLDSSIGMTLDKLGPVRAIVAPSKAHHLFVADYVKAYPEAGLYGAPGLSEKRPELKFQSILDDWPYPVWRGQIEQHLFRGAPLLNEVVFFHPLTRTVIFTDLLFNLTRQQAAQARLFHWLTGAAGHFGPHRLIRRMIYDRSAARDSVETILGWDFDRVIMAHGDLLEGFGRARVRASFSYLWS
jgi:uncharacterized protein DUF4336